MRPIWQRIPWWELAVEIIVLLGLIGLQVGIGIAEDISPSLIVLSTVAVGTMVMLAIANYERWREPLRRRIPSDKELIKAIDGWLGDLNYTRGYVSLKNFSHTLEVSAPRNLQGVQGVRVWIGIEETWSALWFMGYRTDAANQIAISMTPQQAGEVKLDLGLEIARMGAFYGTTSPPNPYSVVFWDTIPIDEHMSAHQVIDRVRFVERIDHLVNSVYLKHSLSITPGAPGSIPPFPPAAPQPMQPSPKTTPPERTAEAAQETPEPAPEER